MTVSTEESPLWRREDDDAIVETQPASGTMDIHSAHSKTTPIPKIQFTILCLLRPLDPMSFTQIFPYINEFMSDLRVTGDPSRIGFYSGLVSSFAFSQLLAVYPWGYLSDRLGRRPVVLIGTFGLSITTLLFGFSTSFTGTILTRALAGLFSGNISVIPTILIELTDQSNQAFAFSFFGFWWPLGAIIGPLIGGLLSNPARRYPSYFDYNFFRHYPYFLPCLLISSFGLVCFVAAGLLLKETLNQKQPEDPRKVPSYGSLGEHSPSEVSKKFTVKELLEIRIIRALCASGCSLSFISTAFDVLFVLFCYSPISTGGLGFPTEKIGLALSASGFIAAVLQVVFMPTILRRVNHAVMYHFCMKIWPFTFLFLPLLNIIARHGVISETGKLDSFTTSLLWCGIWSILCMARVAFLAYSVNMLLIKRFAPNSSSLGSTAGLVQFSICFSRAFSPAFASSLFAFCASRNLIGGYLWVIIMVSLGFLSSLFSKNIVQESVGL
ncbi:major facilitator superfamily multidrug-resistance, DHA1 sub-family [Pholiota conissans]|uniref:Major facilitator superfamily multidrug-resistance, DHA1 sub-family n=1 Tax=Pholiota conissans TaxID=109636 RepID=A0A9P6D5P1_9AGAR|nr:major facilitator superfamily multidrug-resistance, DHA1 sub-family [Pholiota conissans]